ncbi:hypothetical protein [Brevibacillus sp. NRS-1366]|uniref:hypothetical protein n=1 Tax=Brevibacillus sp. NRS-1366 TaxID=3233899 RepID=UPI003D209498
MNKTILLTYHDEKHPHGTFAWFETEEELDEFLEINEVNNIEAIKFHGIQVIR